MPSAFFAQPPQAVTLRSLSAHLWLLVRRFGYLVWQIVVPFRFQLESIAAFPDTDPSIKITDATVKQCQWIFDQAEQRKNQLEQKAQSTFSLMVFLVPLLSSAFLFAASKATMGNTKVIVIVLVCTAAVFVLLGFVSAIRAVGVKTSETLSLGSVLQDDGNFRSYDESFHAKGLLRCASMNTAMNDHLAQFVRGAHSMTAIAVLLLLVAAIPTSIATVKSSSEPTKAKPSGSVEVYPKEPSQHEGQCACQGADTNESRIRALERKLSDLERPRPDHAVHHANR